MKTKRAWICMVISCIMLVFPGCSTPVSGEPSLPEELLKNYMACIGTGDYEKMYGMIHSDAGISKEDFISRNKNIYKGIEAVNIKVEIDGKQGDTVSYRTTMDTMAGPVSFSNQAAFKKYDGIYKLEWKSNLIFPNLNDEDKVRVKTSKGERGSILDRNGIMLAGKDKVYSVGLVPGKMVPETRDKDIEKLAGLLNMTVEAINKKLSEKWVKDDLFVPLKNISYTDEEKQAELLTIKGVGLKTEKDRVYKLGEKAAHLTGYIHNISKEELDQHPGQGYNADSKIGKVGLESLLESRIRGVDGCKIYIEGKDSNEIVVLAERKVVNGKDVTLAIDSALQEKLYDQMKDEKGVALAMNPKTGEVLALVSTPSYDPNDFILGVTEEKWAVYNNEETRPMFNRFKATYVPGSSFKPITAAVGLSEGSFSAKDDFGPSGRAWQKDESWKDYQVTTLKQYSGPANVQNALIYSDNIYFAKAAVKIGGEAFAEGLKSIGFGEDVPFEFGLSPSTFGAKLAFTDEVDLATSGYGQGKVLVNPLYMASVYTAFANEGSMVAPHLEKGKETQVWKKNAFSKDAARMVKNALVQVIENPGGTAHSFKTDGLKMAGKTGTAEIKKSQADTEGTEIGWFVAFPADDNQDKQYLVLAMVEDVKGRGGSHFVIPIVNAMFTD